MITAIREFAIGVALALPFAAMIATYDTWFPIVRGWM